MNTFTLAPDAPAKLTSDQAFSAYLARDSGFVLQLQDAKNVQLGYLTITTGGGSSTLKDRLVWGYSWNTPEVFAHPVPTDIPTSSTWWMFLDANTGERLLGEWQLGA